MRASTHWASVCTAFASALVLLFPGGASAVQTVTSCNFNCTSDCVLGGDYTCTNGQGITLQNGADLDMNGHSLTCSVGVCGYKPAVKMMASSSVVKNTDSAHEAKIVGPFWMAVDCGKQTGSKVTGIRFEGHANIAAYNCSKVENNVFVEAQIGNIYTETVSNNDRIGDNYIADFPNTGIQIVGNKTITVDHNLFVLEQETNYNPLGLELINATGTSVTNNIFMGPGGSPFSGAPASVDNNFCDPTSSGCQSCLADGLCEAPTAPFTLP